jgi:cell division septation protein DedD
MQPKEPTFDRHLNQDSFGPDEAAESPALARRRQLLGSQHSAGEFAVHGGDEPRQRTLLPEAELESAAPEPEPDIPPLPAGTGPRSAGFAPRAASAPVRARPGRGLLYLGGAAVVIVAALGWWLWPRGGEGGPGEAPLVVAEQGPEKVRPQEEGGMQVPNQDIRIYNELTGNQPPAEPEVLLPQPETPMTPPAATVETQPSTGATAATGETATPPVVPAPPEAPAEAQMAPAAGTQAAEATAPSQPAQPAEQAAPSAPAAAAETQSTPPAAAVAQAEPTAPAAATAQPAKPATQTAAAGGAYRVQLAAVKSADAAKAAWTKISKANADALKGLSLKVVKVDRGSDGALYRVQGGPLADRAAADSVCSRLKQKGQACMVVAP